MHERIYPIDKDKKKKIFSQDKNLFNLKQAFCVHMEKILYQNRRLRKRK